MCGRFALTSKTKEIERLLPDVRVKVDLKPRYNIAPSQNIAAVLNTNPSELVGVRWGLIPSWAKDSTFGNNMINARAEGITEKPAFKYPFRKKRCLILADCFYEWKQIAGEKKKQPYLIRMKSGEPFTFAGLWDSWNDPDEGLINSATIITTQPNSLMTLIHNRMPVIISRNNMNLWLSSNSESEVLLSLLSSYPADEMTAFPISLAVNSPANDYEDVQKELI